MKRGSTIFLQVVIALLGVGVLALLLWEPQVEGRNVNATQFEIYFKDPFLAYIYLAFVPFFVGLYQAFKILGYARRKGIFFQRSVRALRIIKYCALTTAIFILGAEAYLFIFMRGKEKMSVTELADKVGITMANISVLKNGRAKAIRLSTLEAICRA